MKRIVKILAVLFTLIFVSRTVSIAIVQAQLGGRVHLFYNYAIMLPTLFLFVIALVCWLLVMINNRIVRNSPLNLN